MLNGVEQSLIAVAYSYNKLRFVQPKWNGFQSLPGILGRVFVYFRFRFRFFLIKAVSIKALFTLACISKSTFSEWHLIQRSRLLLRIPLWEFSVWIQFHLVQNDYRLFHVNKRWFGWRPDFPRRNYVWGNTAKIPCWGRTDTHLWEVFLIGTLSVVSLLNSCERLSRDHRKSDHEKWSLEYGLFPHVDRNIPMA